MRICLDVANDGYRKGRVYLDSQSVTNHVGHLVYLAVGNDGNLVGAFLSPEEATQLRDSLTQALAEITTKSPETDERLPSV